MTKTELLELITNGESSGVEFKRDTIDSRALAKARALRPFFSPRSWVPELPPWTSCRSFSTSFKPEASVPLGWRVP